FVQFGLVRDKPSVVFPQKPRQRAALDILEVFSKWAGFEANQGTPLPQPVGDPWPQWREHIKADCVQHLRTPWLWQDFARYEPLIEKWRCARGWNQGFHSERSCGMLSPVLSRSRLFWKA